MKWIFLNIFIILFLSACAIQRAQVAASAQKSMVGMTKEQVLQCMGAASNIQKAGNVESWEYYSGGQSFVNTNINANGSFATANSSVTTRYCIINIVFINGSVGSVSYSGRTGGLLSAGEQCAYAVSNCLK